MLAVTMSDPFSQVQGGSLLIDSSTIAPDEARQLASLSEHKAVEFIDAPVSGGVCVCWAFGSLCKHTFGNNRHY